MQASDPLKQRTGSFSKPQDLIKNIERSEAGIKTEPPAPTQSENNAATVVPEKPIEKSPEDEMNELRAKYIETTQKKLGIIIDDSALKDYLFKGVLSREVQIVPGLMTGVMRTLRTSETQEIEIRMAAIRDIGNQTPVGLENEKAIITLSYQWTHADGKDLGSKPEQREEKIRKMGNHLTQAASNVRVDFETLLSISLQQKGVLKK